MIRKQRLQQKIIQTRATFPVTVTLVALLWFLSGKLDVSTELLLNYENCFWASLQPQGFWASLVNVLMCSGSIYLLVELNNVYSIIGLPRTMLHACIFLMLWVSAPFVSHQPVVNVIIFCLLLVIFKIFECYQLRDSVTNVFQLFIFIGVAALFAPKCLFFVPIFYIALFVCKALNLRSFFAGLIGVLLPFWFLFGHAFWHDEMAMFYAPFLELVTFRPIDYSIIPLGGWMTIGYTLVLSVISIVYLFINSYQDKLRTRTYIFFISFFVIYSFILFMLQPQCVAFLLSFMIVGSCILSSHMFVLSTSKICNIFFICSIVIIFVMTIFNIWMPLYSFL